MIPSKYITEIIIKKNYYFTHQINNNKVRDIPIRIIEDEIKLTNSQLLDKILKYDISEINNTTPDKLMKMDNEQLKTFLYVLTKKRNLSNYIQILDTLKLNYNAIINLFTGEEKVINARVILKFLDKILDQDTKNNIQTIIKTQLVDYPTPVISAPSLFTQLYGLDE